MGLLSSVKKAFFHFNDDDAMTAGAALAFYSALSLAPLVLLFVSLAGLAGSTLQDSIVTQFRNLVGPDGGDMVQMIIDNAEKKPESGIMNTIVSSGILIASASAVFAQFQASLNKILHLEPPQRSGLVGWIRKRLLSIGMLFTLGFFMLVSLIMSAAMELVMFQDEGMLWQSINFIVSVSIFSLFFAAVYRYLPDKRMYWNQVWTGAIVTGLLFSLGKTAIGIYLGNSAVGSAYGAAGSLIVLLVWVYYSSLIILFGAELTRSLSKQ